MKKREKKPITPGGTPHIYIPTSASERAIDWLNNQKSIGSSLITLIEGHLDSLKEETVVTLDLKTRKAITRAVQESVNNTLTEVFDGVELGANKPVKFKKASMDMDKLFSLSAPQFKLKD